MAKRCCVCKKKIHLWQRPWASKCTKCNSDLHSKCKVIALDYESYCNEIIEHEPYCPECVETNSIKFGENRYCPECHFDISVSEAQAYCDVCGSIGHDDCYQKHAEAGELIYIYPYMHDYASHEHLCPQCHSEVDKKIDAVKSALSGWIKATKKEYIRDYKIIEEIGPVTSGDVECKFLSSVEELLKIRSVQRGGNALIKLNAGLKKERIPQNILIGYDRNGRPRYKIDHIFKEYFSGSAYAVRVVPLEQVFGKSQQ